MKNEKIFRIRAIRSANSIFGYAECWTKFDGEYYEGSEENMVAVAAEIQASLVTTNVIYEAVEYSSTT